MAQAELKMKNVNDVKPFHSFNALKYDIDFCKLIKTEIAKSYGEDSMAC